MKDFFISYTSADREWAEWIAWQLEEAGYSVDIQVWDFHPSDDFIAEMDRASREAERTLAVLTPKYFESRFTQAEWTAAFARGNLLPARVADFDVEGLLSVRVYIDLVGKDEAQVKEALLTGVKLERRKPDTAPSFPRPSAPERSVTERPRFPGALPPIWNVPHQRNPNFVGRDSLLDQIRQTLRFLLQRTGQNDVGMVGSQVFRQCTPSGRPARHLAMPLSNLGNLQKPDLCSSELGSSHFDIRRSASSSLTTLP